MKKFIVFSVFILLYSSASAAINCKGNVTKVLDNNNACTSVDPVSGALVAHLAYKITPTDNETSSTTINQWLCSKTDRSDALIMGAYFSGKKLSVRVTSSTCENLGGTYVKPQYLYVD